jgi:hypothetical protein
MKNSIHAIDIQRRDRTDISREVTDGTFLCEMAERIDHVHLLSFHMRHHRVHVIQSPAELSDRIHRLDFILNFKTQETANGTNIGARVLNQ